jgi:alpha-1,3-mannosyltransferase
VARLLTQTYKSLALSIKMSIILYLPGLLVVLFKRGGLLRTLGHLFVLLLSQLVIAASFLREHPWSYLQASFDLQRVFLYEWTVNWRFVTEATFLSSAWSRGLLIGHASALLAFGMFKWCQRDGTTWKVLERGFRRPTLPASLSPVTADCELDPRLFSPIIQ